MSADPSRVRPGPVDPASSAGATIGAVLAGDVVHLEISPVPAQVRTARLLASAVARRAGLDPALLDEVRLAVGEASARAVELHARHEPLRPVEVDLSWTGGRLTASVRDHGPDEAVSDDPRALGAAVLHDAELPAGLGLAVVHGLVDDVTVEQVDGGGTRVTMSWPLAPRAWPGSQPGAAHG